MLTALALAAAVELSRLPAAEADQGVAVDEGFVYAIDNSKIGKYDRKTGAKVAAWSGDPARFPHINSCVVLGAVMGKELVCAASNFPAVPMLSRLEVFDPKTLTHLRTVELGHQAGSLTWVDRKDGAWWAGFANYDGHGGEPGRDHTATALVRFDDAWKATAAWTFPAEVLARMAPMSASGGAFGPDGRLYVSGHDRPELYVLEPPKGGGVLRLVATIAVPTNGQAIAFDRSAKGAVLYGISRAKHEVVAMRLPPVEGK